MNKRKRGRPPNTERQSRGDLLWLEERMAVGTAAMRRRCLKPKKVLARAAAELDMSERKAYALLAQMKRERAVDVSTPFGVALREWFASQPRD